MHWLKMFNRRRIIELIDLHQADGPEASSSLDKVISSLAESTQDHQQHTQLDLTHSKIHNRNINNNNHPNNYPDGHCAEEYTAKKPSAFETSDDGQRRRRNQSDDECIGGMTYDDPLATWADNILENGDRYDGEAEFGRYHYTIIRIKIKDKRFNWSTFQLKYVLCNNSPLICLTKYHPYIPLHCVFIAKIIPRSY